MLLAYSRYRLTRNLRCYCSQWQHDNRRVVCLGMMAALAWFETSRVPHQTFLNTSQQHIKHEREQSCWYKRLANIITMLFK
ncbi:hypothetical protein SFRURICE_014454 [Spodoptera frugiperda]|nr:hypothetical protein SFRURICE_014454 [Spodoptera frugiperda]